MKIFENYAARYDRTREEDMSVQEYLDLCKRDPMAYSTAAERMLKAIGEPELLDTRHDPNAVGVRGGECLGNPVHRVVIGESDGGESCRLRRCYHGGRRLGAIGRSRVGMQVDMRPLGPGSAGRCSTHFV